MPKKQSKATRAALESLRIALTVAQDDPISPAASLNEQGATVFHYPVAQTLPPDSYDPLDAALMRCRSGEATWLLLPTPCAVEAVTMRLHSLNITAADLGETSVAIFGASTQRLIAQQLPDLPIAHARFTTHTALVAALDLTPDDAVVVPIAQRSRADWAELVAATGATVDAVPAYRLLLGRGGDDVAGMLWAGQVDVVLFHTENSVRHFAIRLKAEGGTLDMLNDLIIACLDEATATAARTFGLVPQIVVPAEADDAISYLARVLGSEQVQT